jgi:hypothetical protein
LVAKAFLEYRISLKGKAPEPEISPLPNEEVIEAPDNIQEMADMTIREVVDRFGTCSGFSDWLDCVKKIEDIHDRRLKNGAKENELIGREFVKLHLFNLVDTSYSQLLNDAPGTIATRLASEIKSGATKEHLEKVTQDIIKAHIKNIKAKSRKLLNEKAD